VSFRERRPAGEERPSAVRDGLDALREEAPSEDSRRATLAALGLDPKMPVAAAPARTGRSAAVSFLAWLAAGLALVLAVAALLRWLSG